jgi:hypothetical protein
VTRRGRGWHRSLAGYGSRCARGSVNGQFGVAVTWRWLILELCRCRIAEWWLMAPIDGNAVLIDDWSRYRCG